ncbi:hypothetical protein, partial [Roseibium sp.]|uniref:hypothetical protein n=1 Tax=Roseibium sp. TaxID=1936156 RepID=UPI003D0BE178
EAAAPPLEVTGDTTHEIGRNLVLERFHAAAPVLVSAWCARGLAGDPDTSCHLPDKYRQERHPVLPSTVIPDLIGDPLSSSALQFQLTTDSKECARSGRTERVERWIGSPIKSGMTSRENTDQAGANSAEHRLAA